MSLYAYLADLEAWINNPSISQRTRARDGGDEGGVDLSSPAGTPVYAIASGPIIASGNYSGGDVLTTRINVPGYGTQDLYYQHIRLDPSITDCGGFCSGSQVVQAGQQIGVIADPSYTGGPNGLGGGYPHIEMGFNAGWCCIWGDPNNHPGPWVTDPRPMLATLAGMAPQASSTSSSSSNGTSSNSGIFGGLQSMITTFLDVLIILVIAVVLGYFGFKLLTGLDIGKMTKPAMHSAETLAKVA